MLGEESAGDEVLEGRRMGTEGDDEVGAAGPEEEFVSSRAKEGNKGANLEGSRRLRGRGKGSAVTGMSSSDRTADEGLLIGNGAGKAVDGGGVSIQGGKGGRRRRGGSSAEHNEVGRGAGGAAASNVQGKLDAGE